MNLGVVTCVACLHRGAVWSSPFDAGTATKNELCGVVVDESGTGVKVARVVGSSGNVTSLATDSGGTFCVKSPGAFISVNQVGLNPIVKAISAPATPIRLALLKADASVRAMSNCRSSAGRIGGGLRIKPPHGRHRGPIDGEHDAHWYAHNGNLQVIAGAWWYFGLRRESLLIASENRSLGTAKDGSRWRWIGAPISAAVHIRECRKGEAGFFDEILDSACYSEMSSNAAPVAMLEGQRNSRLGS